MHQEKISIIGVGGAGCRIVDVMAARMAPSGPAMIAINTDARSLATMRATTKLQIGSKRTRGRGAGGDANVGRLAAEDDAEMIRGLVEGVDLVILIVGLGGGTGTGAAPVVLRAAREANALSLCVATLPLGFEGQQRREQAEKALPSVRDSADALITVPNERLAEFVAEKNVADCFEQIDQVLATGVSSLWKLLTRPGFITLDFADLQKVARNAAGICTFGYGEGRGKTRAEAAVDAFVSSPLLDGGKALSQAKSLLVSIAGGPDLALKEVGDIMAAISAKVPKDAEIVMGTVVDDDWKSRITITAIVSEQWSASAGRKASEAPTEHTLQQKEVPQEGARAGRPKQVQTKLRFDASGTGRFQNVEPTIMDGQDLDIPTFIRRNLVIER